MGADCCMEAVAAVVGVDCYMEAVEDVGRIGGLEGIGSLGGMMAVAGRKEVSSL